MINILKRLTSGSMILKELTGYMLSNDNIYIKPGSRWMDFNDTVWVCRNLKTAQKILRQSKDTPIVTPDVNWTTIYRVTGKNLICPEMADGLVYITNPRNLIVDKIVSTKDPEIQASARALQNADRCAAVLHKFGKCYN